MSKDKGEWSLQLCDKCVTMTNHDDDGCLRCRTHDDNQAKLIDKLSDPETMKRAAEGSMEKRNAVIDRTEQDNTAMDELFELCKQVYEKTGWKMPKSSRNRFYNIKGSLVKNENDRDDAWTFPLYTSDYLLDKLPKEITSFYGKAYPLSPQVMASGAYFYAMYKHDMTGPNSTEVALEQEADTPLKALLKLCLELSEEGEV